jgi:L-lactate dehydrogenase complex protein LldF
MPGQFRARIRTSLADANLQSALDANAERRIHVRQVAFASLDDPQLLRQRAHQVRADVIDHLDDYLDQFCERLTQNGMQVHRAADADQAVAIILEIARRKGAKLVAKSKTMVSEEIKLNHALERAGLKVVETDLGEYIVQLRGEGPSHIITPAVHLLRQDVGRLFAQKLGMPYTEDVSVMTDAARRILRQVFLEADIGISGVNFGVAQTGTLCVVTNEGNGRMVTTLPQTHIALMGIERLVPTMDDLALMLSLLPRSATGQKLSVYTSLLNAPRRPDDPDGPLERHVVLVDNGRSAVRDSGLREILYCIRCGACLNACPVFREIGGHGYLGVDGEGSPYPGPMGSVLSPALFGQSEFGQLARASSLCGACREVCPVDIDLPKLLLRVRAGNWEKKPGNRNKPNAPRWLAMGIHLFALATKSPRLFNTVQRGAGLLSSLTGAATRGESWMHLPAFTGWGASRDFPAPAAQPFRLRYTQQAYKDLEEGDFQVVHHEHSESDTVEGDVAQPPDPGNLQQFASELEALGANFHSCLPEDAWQTILSILRGRGIEEILAWDASHFLEGLLDRLSSAGIRIHFPSAQTLPITNQVRAGLTGVTAAIAETGSLLLPGGSGRPLVASLLPVVHIAVVKEKDVYARLSDVLRAEAISQASASALVTGPSRTADIEMTLTIGVHGPGELHVVCLPRA